MEILFTALADAIIGLIISDVALSPALQNIRSSLSGGSSEKRALELALNNAYNAFQIKYPRLSESLFDEYFLLKPDVSSELAKILLPHQHPNSSKLNEFWSNQFPQRSKPNIEDEIEYFLDQLDSEVKSRSELRKFVDTINLERIADNSDTQVELLTQIYSLFNPLNTHTANNHNNSPSNIYFSNFHNKLIPYQDLFELYMLIEATKLDIQALKEIFHQVIDYNPSYRNKIDDISSNSEMISFLADIPSQSRGMHPLILFANEINSTTNNTELSLWIENHKNEVINGSKPYTIYSQEQQNFNNYYIMVIVFPDPNNVNKKTKHYRFEIFVWSEEKETKLLESSNIQIELDDLVVELSNSLSRHIKHTKIKYKRKPIIEFFLPCEHFLREIEFEIEQSITPRRKMKIGKLYQCVIRSQLRLEYIENPDFDVEIWNSNWRNFQQIINERCSTHITNLYAIEKEIDIFDHLMSISDKPCISLPFKPKLPVDLTDINNIILSLIDAGIPVAVWGRNHLHDNQIYETKLRELLANYTLGDLRSIIHEERNNNATKISNHFALFWDDPTRLPPNYDLDATVFEIE